ncbi:uncharacterized protein ANIA_00401 [Aspergillus nidulans FGSC A4]|uniref:GST N-terminal domain-containing protein n=1 Tax=Emericella nidulans (strain FGSC A4 / ATCC 38163 / CBS 112.46 / NRRL 194 / M139) TaxID=227321 RepID=C8VTI5_EMENI|nr:hypothetical protein [Aspergillus nidulans FGSC A4]CBF89559.1 TPA: conserved hypothetical protein [Aspergillus nidulans FGSC A4]
MSQYDYHLIGTNTRYSSWTARVETVLEYFQIPYTNEILPLDQARTCSPSAKFPLLRCHSLCITINDSLAIVEFLADRNPHLHLWPSDPALRALARSATAEMHSGFMTLRSTFHTNFIAKYTERVAQDQDEGFLFGKFSIADAWFWPVLWRFRTYNLPLDNVTPEALEWMEKMWSDPLVKKLVYGFYRQAEDPKTRIEKYEGLFAEEGVVYETFPEDWVFTVSTGA